MIKKILITGSSGQVGSHLVEYFIGRYDVLGLDIRDSNIPAVDKITIRGDVRNKNIVSGLTKKVDAITNSPLLAEKSAT